MPHPRGEVESMNKGVYRDSKFVAKSLLQKIQQAFEGKAFVAFSFLKTYGVAREARRKSVGLGYARRDNGPLSPVGLLASGTV